MKERIEKRIEELKDQIEQNKLNAVACQGAIGELEALLKDPEPEKEEPTEK